MKASKLVRIGLGVAAVALAYLVFVLIITRTPPPPALPNPNGYDDLVRAGQAITGDLSNPAALEGESLRALVTTNAETLKLTRLGLSRACRVPTESAARNMNMILADLPRLKAVARLLCAEGRLAEIDSRPAEAARSYADVIRLGLALSQGGFIIHRLVGIACESMGGRALVNLLPQLTREEMGVLAAELEKIDGSGVTWDEVRRNENRFARAQLGPVPNPLRALVGFWQTRAGRVKTEEKHTASAAHLKLVMTELALRCYACDEGSPPKNLGQLVPRYLARVPSDPFGTGEFGYHVEGTNWVLYSVGPDKIDNGGQGGDLVYGAW
jgi:hypothetical protein